MDKMDKMDKMNKMNIADKINKMKQKWGKLTTDNPLSNRGTMAICCRVLLSAVLDYKVPGTSISMCTFTAVLTYSALSDPHSHCFQWFPGLGGPRGKHPWQGLSSQTGLALTSRLRAGIGQLLPG